MLTYSIVWLVLAAAVIIIARHRSAPALQNSCPTPATGDTSAPSERGSGFALLAIVYGLLLLAGFVYVSWRYGLELLIK